MKALVIDDLQDNLMIFDRLLCSQGFSNNTLMASPKILLEWLKSDPTQLENFDVILMDISLPDISGLDLSKLIKGNPRFKDIPMIVVSARIDEKAKEAAGLIGCEYYLKKPISINDIRFVKIIAESYSKLKEKKNQLTKEISELNVLKEKFQGYFSKAASSQDIAGLRFEDPHSDFIGRDWRYCLGDKEIFSGIMFDFEWKSTQGAEPPDFEYFVKLLLKRAVLIVSAQFKKIPVRFLHDGGAEFYVNLPRVTAVETKALAESLQAGIAEFIGARPEFKHLGFYICRLSTIPEKGAKPESFLFTLRNGLLSAKAQNIILVDASVDPFKKAS